MYAMKKLLPNRTSEILILIPLVFCLALAGCSLFPTAPDNTGMQTLTPQAAADSLSYQLDNLSQNRRYLEMRIHDLINVKRAQSGLRALDWEEKLSEVARYHSQDMADRNYFDHLSPEGEDFSARYAMFGYDPTNRVGNMVYLGAENLFLNNLYDSYSYNKDTGEVMEYSFSTLEDIANSTVDGWMNSEGHRENILMPHFKKEGIGIVFTPEGKIYITENFS
jgi:uncharacterized protein YkwD